MATRFILANPITIRTLSTTPIYGAFGPLKGLLNRVQPFQSSIRRFYMPKFYADNFSMTAQSKFAWGSVLGASAIIGLICPRPRIAHAINGFDILEDDRHLGFSDVSGVDEDQRNLLAITRKFMPPFLLFVTILMNLDHPAILAIKLILILLGTKPSPLSIYISIEQLRRRYMREHPILFRFKSLYANKVEVEDYAFMCLARVELKDQKFTLIGILGNWWVFSPSTTQRPFTVFRDKVMRYIRN